MTCKSRHRRLNGWRPDDVQITSLEALRAKLICVVNFLFFSDEFNFELKLNIKKHSGRRRKGPFTSTYARGLIEGEGIGLVEGGACQFW